MKTVRVVAAVIKAVNEKRNPLFCNLTWLRSLKRRLGISRWKKNRTWRDTAGSVKT